MKMKTYRGETLQNAMQQVKEELGPEAVILKSKKIARNIMGKKEFEITAGLEDSLYARPGDHDTDVESFTYNGRGRRGPAIEVKSGESDEFFSKRMDDLFDLLKGVRREFSTLRGNLEAIQDSLKPLNTESFASDFKVWRDIFLDQGFGNISTRRILRALEMAISPQHRGDTQRVRRALQKILQNTLPVQKPLLTKPGRSQVIAFAGPGGAGKTTMLWKMASHFRYEQNLSIGVISAEGNRVGGTGPMELFCRAADIPLEILQNPEDAPHAMKKFSGKDVVFVDTRACHPGNHESVRDIEVLFQGMLPDAVHLVLNGTVGAEGNIQVCEGLKTLGIRDLILTRLDEMRSLGGVYETAVRTGIPLSYLGNGQEIPDSLMPADRKTLAGIFLESLPQPHPSEKGVA